MIPTIAAVWLQSDSNNAFGALFGGMFMLVWLAILVVTIVGGWKMYEKAGQPGWAVLVPIYHLYILLKIVGRPWWWLLLCLIPLVNVVILIVVAIDLAKSFGQSAVFGVILLAFLAPIGYLILGFGDSRYLGPAAKP